MSKKQILKNKHYGYYDPSQKTGTLRMNKNQLVSGYPIGIVYIGDADYPMIPGNVNNAYTYDYPVLLRTMPNMSQERIFNGDPTIADDIIEMGKYMIQREGIRALSSGCGFYGNFQKKVSDALDIPVALSPLVMIPWISTLIKSDQKIAVLTANAASLSQNLFENCGITDPDRLVIKDLRDAPEFSCVVDYRGEFDSDIACQEVTAKAMEVMEGPDEIGAFVFECSDMPPYSYAVQNATQRPVFDFINLINFLHGSVTQHPYSGWL